MRSALSLSALCALGWIACSTTAERDGGKSARPDLVKDAGGRANSASPGVLDESGLRESELRRQVEFLASDAMNGREEGTKESAAARAFLIEELTASGVKPAVDGSFEQRISTGDGTNVLGFIEGTSDTLKQRVVVLSAHYDHLGSCGGAICNGANDNAAGVSMVLGVARALASQPPARSVLVALWDSEEPPTFLKAAMGSQFYVDHPVFPLESTDAAVVLDLVGADGWPGFTGRFVLGAETSPELSALLRTTPVPADLNLLPAGLHLAEKSARRQQPWSDYDAFRNKKRPVLFFTNGQNRQYHTPADEVSALNLPLMALEASYLHTLTRAVADAPETLSFDAEGKDYPRDVASLKTLLEAALATGGLVESLGLSAATRSALEADRAAIAALSAATSLQSPDVQTLRSAAQRMLCLMGGSYDEAVCRSL